MKINCQNCGHDCHCDKICVQSNVDEFGNKNTFDCCKNCRHESFIDEEKYNIES